MRAIVVTEPGPPSSLKVTDDAPRPERAEKNEVLVRVVGAGVNPVDWKIRAGGLPAVLPQIPGGDLSGVVVEGDETGKFKEGDRVFALTDGFSWTTQTEGCYAEFCAAPAASFAPAPTSVPLVDAAAVPLVSLTAWQMLSHAPDEAIKGKRVLVHAGAGGVGHVGRLLFFSSLVLFRSTASFLVSFFLSFRFVFEMRPIMDFET